MAKRTRPEPYTQGSIAEIYRHFFGKLIHHKPEALSIKEWMEHLFDLPNRDITLYAVNEPFTMPGLLYVASSKPVQGIGYRIMKPGTPVWVRHNARNPKAVDIEFNGGRGEKEQVFQLTQSQWNSIAASLREPTLDDKKAWRKTARAEEK